MKKQNEELKLKKNTEKVSKKELKKLSKNSSKKQAKTKDKVKKKNVPSDIKKTQSFQALSRGGKKEAIRSRKEAIEEKKIDKNDKEQIAKRKKGALDLNDFTIIKEGIKNDYFNAHGNYLLQKRKLAEYKTNNKNGSNKIYIDSQKEKLKKAKTYLEGQEKIFKKEHDQIEKLNNFSKGKPAQDNNEGDIITVQNANKIYAGKKTIFQALKNVDVSIKRGTFNVILGPSGSGKTTLLNMISGLDRPTYGSIIINNVDISGLTTSQLTNFRRRNIGFVFQSYNLLPSLNVKENIEVGRSLQTKKTKRMDISEILEQIELAGSEKKKVYELSGGQQQRVSIARAIAKTPDILIGDEATGALDSVTSVKVLRLFQRLNKENGTTVILVTHNPDIAKLAHQVIYVKNGRIDNVKQNKRPLNAENIKEI